MTVIIKDLQAQIPLVGCPGCDYLFARCSRVRRKTLRKKIHFYLLHYFTQFIYLTFLHKTVAIFLLEKYLHNLHIR